MTKNAANNRKKRVRTDDDFDDMNWHGCRIYAVAFYPETFELAFDIDYVFSTEKDETQFRFWVSPATLVFSNVRDLELSISSWNGGLEISSISRTAIGKPINHEYIKRDIEWLWLMECEEGEIILKSVGFNQYIRRQAILTEIPSLLPEERGIASFSRQFES